MTATDFRRPRGQDLVEFALTLPLLLLLVLAILDLGRVTYFYSTLQNAVREGARWGIIRPNDNAGVESIVRERALGLDPAELTRVEITYNDAEHTLKVRFRYRFTPLTPLVGAFLPGNQATLTASSTMNHEY